MAVHEHPHRNSGFRLPSFRPSARGNVHTSATESRASAGTGTHTAPALALASLRLLTGFVFLWAFLDKTFGLGYATASGKGWIDGGPGVRAAPRIAPRPGPIGPPRGRAAPAGHPVRGRRSYRTPVQETATCPVPSCTTPPPPLNPHS